MGNSNIKVRLNRHQLALNSVFQREVDVMALAEIELEGNRLAVKYCNGDLDSERFQVLLDALKARTIQIVGAHPALHFNSDPRGYFLKLNDDWMRSNRDVRIETDFGGYGILAPEWMNQAVDGGSND